MRTAIALAITLGVVGSVHAQEASDAVLQRYITIGADDDLGDIRASCTARPGGWTQAFQALGNSSGGRVGSTEQYSVGTTTWLARVAVAARSAKTKFMPLPTTEDMRALAETPAFVVNVSPLATEYVWRGITE